MKHLLTILSLLLVTSCTEHAVHSRSYQSKSYAGHAYVGSVNSALLAVLTTEPDEEGSGYDESQDAAGAGALIDHLTNHADESCVQPV